MDPILDDLNPEQRRAVLFGEGPLMVLAGAGSGKTRVITRRIARLLRDGEDPGSILALTFTNKAAEEMARRAQELGGQRVLVCTFHSACARFLRRDGELLGYPRDYSIYDTYDRDACIKMLLEGLGLSGPGIKASHIGRCISRLKNQQVAPHEFQPGLGEIDDVVARVYGPYEERLRALGAMDFDDLLLRFLDLLREHPDVAERYRRRYRWILVDEFQDTNRVQYALLRELLGDGGNPCVVGDPDQSIYAFRGADLRNILEFERDFPGTVTIRLEQNYRSTRTILRAADEMIANNRDRLPKVLRTENEDGVPLVCLRARDAEEEAREIAGRVAGLVQDGVAVDEIAVFFRAHFLSRALEEAFRSRDLPYEIVGGLSFFERREIKDLLAFLRVTLNPLDDVSAERIVNVPPRGIGKATLGRLREIAAAEEMSLCEVITEPSVRRGLSARACRGLDELARTIECMRQQAEDGAAAPLRTLLERTRYVEYACDLGDPEDVARQENIEELLADAQRFDEDQGGGLPGYLARVSLLTSEDRAGRAGPRVSLMTVHAAKGLEFDHVFVAGLEEGLFPHSRSTQSAYDVEEERRLLYVALTRARKGVVLTYAARRQVQGVFVDREPSRFLAEIPPDCLESSADPWRHWEPDEEFGAPPAAAELQPGHVVVHPDYGTGEVVEVSRGGLRAAVRFADGSLRILLPDHEVLRVLPEGEEG